MHRAKGTTTRAAVLVAAIAILGSVVTVTRPASSQVPTAAPPDVYQNFGPRRAFNEDKMSEVARLNRLPAGSYLLTGVAEVTTGGTAQCQLSVTGRGGHSRAFVPTTKSDYVWTYSVHVTRAAEVPEGAAVVLSCFGFRPYSTVTTGSDPYGKPTTQKQYRPWVVSAGSQIIAQRVNQIVNSQSY